MCTKIKPVTASFYIYPAILLIFMLMGPSARAADPKIYAVVVGVSKYADAGLNLGYADKDAQAFAAFLQTPNCGSTPPGQIALLVNQEATRVNVIDKIQRFADLASSNDVLIIYFSGHGSNATARNEFFMETYDTDPNRITATATAARDVESILSGSLAKMTFWITDACNSGNISGRGGKGIAASGAARYFDAVAKAHRGGFVYLASSESQQITQEGPEYGGGHGMFTYYLIEGLKGKADADNNGIVTINESFDYVHQRVAAASNGTQIPVLGDLYFNGRFPMSAPFNYDGLKSQRRQFHTPDSRNGQRPTDQNDDNSVKGSEKIPIFNKTLPVNSFTETHIEVTRGETVVIVATGQINVGPWVGLSGPEGHRSGLAGFSISQYSIVKNFNHAVLMFKLVSTDNWTACGANYKFKATQNGELIFEVNDNDQGNNSGAYTVNVQKFQ